MQMAKQTQGKNTGSPDHNYKATQHLNGESVMTSLGPDQMDAHSALCILQICLRADPCVVLVELSEHTPF